MPAVPFTTFYVRGMVCPRCLLVVRRLVAGLGLTPVRVELGEVSIAEAAAVVPWPALAHALAAVGFELLHPRARQLCLQLAALIDQLLLTDPCAVGWGAGGLAAHLACPAAALRAACRTEWGEELTTYLTRRRVDAAQVLLRAVPRLSVQMVARQVGYASQAHLCRQFRAMVGTSPSAWRALPPAGAPECTEGTPSPLPFSTTSLE